MRGNELADEGAYHRVHVGQIVSQGEREERGESLLVASARRLAVAHVHKGEQEALGVQELIEERHRLAAHAAHARRQHAALDCGILLLTGEQESVGGRDGGGARGAHCGRLTDTATSTSDIGKHELADRRRRRRRRRRRGRAIGR